MASVDTRALFALAVGVVLLIVGGVSANLAYGGGSFAQQTFADALNTTADKISIIDLASVGRTAGAALVIGGVGLIGVGIAMLIRGLLSGVTEAAGAVNF